MKILVVIDMQNDFITGPLGTPEAQAIVPKVIEKINQYMGEDCLRFYTMDTHHDGYLDTLEGKKLPTPHCIRRTEGWEIPTELLSHNGIYVYKDSFGAYVLPEIIDDKFSEYMEDPIIENIELVGLCTDICVISNAMILKSYFPNVPIIVDSSCCAGTTPESHENALKAMKMCHIDVI